MNDPADTYNALLARLRTPPRRVARAWDDRHPAWHPPVADDATIAETLDSLPRLPQRLVAWLCEWDLWLPRVIALMQSYATPIPSERFATEELDTYDMDDHDQFVETMSVRYAADDVPRLLELRRAVEALASGVDLSSGRFDELEQRMAEFHEAIDAWQPAAQDDDTAERWWPAECSERWQVAGSIAWIAYRMVAAFTGGQDWSSPLVRDDAPVDGDMAADGFDPAAYRHQWHGRWQSRLAVRDPITATLEWAAPPMQSCHTDSEDHQLRVANWCALPDNQRGQLLETARQRRTGDLLELASGKQVPRPPASLAPLDPGEALPRQ